MPFQLFKLDTLASDEWFVGGRRKVISNLSRRLHITLKHKTNYFKGYSTITTRVAFWYEPFISELYLAELSQKID